MTLQHHPSDHANFVILYRYCIIGAICVLFGQQSPGVTIVARGAAHTTFLTNIYKRSDHTKSYFGT